MKRFALLLLCAAALCARADTDFYDLPATGAATTVRPGGKIVWVDAVSTNAGYTATVSLVRESWTFEDVVETFAATNFTYTVVTTNSIYFGTNAVLVTTTNTAARPWQPLPARATAYWTNVVDTASWAETNRVPRLFAAETNTVTAGTTWAAPGDLLLLQSAAPDGTRVTVGIQR